MGLFLGLRCLFVSFHTNPSSMAGKTDMFGCMVHGGDRKMANGMGNAMGRCMHKCLSGKMAPRMRGKGDPIGRANGLGDLGPARGRNKRTSWF